jgi:hypothetical protein
MKSVCQRNICIPVFVTALFTIAKMWNQPNYQWMSGYRKWGIYIYIYIYTHTIKYHSEGNPAICDNMDEARGHCSKWNKCRKTSTT